MEDLHQVLDGDFLPQLLGPLLDSIVQILGMRHLTSPFLAVMDLDENSNPVATETTRQRQLLSSFETIV